MNEEKRFLYYNDMLELLRRVGIGEEAKKAKEKLNEYIYFLVLEKYKIKRDLSNISFYERNLIGKAFYKFTAKLEEEQQQDINKRTR